MGCDYRYFEEKVAGSCGLEEDGAVAEEEEVFGEEDREVITQISKSFDNKVGNII